MKHLKLFENFDNDDNIDLSIELENKMRTIGEDSDMTVDGFLAEFGIEEGEMTGFGWAAILKNAKQYADMTDEEFSKVYNEYKENQKKEDN